MATMNFYTEDEALDKVLSASFEMTGIGKVALW